VSTRESSESSVPRTKTELLKTKLRDYNVEPDDLMVVGAANGDMIIGESKEGLTLNGSMRLKNPKRLARIQQNAINRETQQVQITINFMVGDYDLMQSGYLSIWPFVGYLFQDLGEESLDEMLTLYIQFFERKREHRLLQSGIALPGRTQ
jgi:hypothetical protein